MSQKQSTFKPSEVYSILKDTIEANDKIMKSGGIPVSISVVGEPGMGKTTICRELAQDLKRGFYKLNLAQLTEPSELIGFYQRESQMVKDKETVWVTENLIPKYADNGYTYTGETRTIPCPPDWVVGLEDNSILLLDDFSRSNTLFNQAVMELVNEQTVPGWDLKSKKIQIILTENPDDGEYNVTAMDKAQSDRMLRINMRWDAQDWAVRAEKIGLDERLINFVLWAPELLENKKSDGISASGSVSPRMMDKFFSLVSTIDDFEKNLDKITLFGSISVGNHVVSQLTNFIHKRLDKLPSIDKLIMEYDLATAKSELTKCCGDYEKDPNNFKTPTAAILTTRIYNYMRFNHNKVAKAEIKKFLEILLHSSFTPDQKMIMVKQTISLNNQFQTICAGDPRFIKHITQ